MDNVKRGLDKLDEMQVQYKKIIQVISWYAQRRAHWSLKTFTTKETELIRINTFENSHELNQNNWYTSQRGIELIFNEFIKLKMQSIGESA